MTRLRDPLEELLPRLDTCAELGSKAFELLSIIDMLFRVDALRLAAHYLRDPDQHDHEIDKSLSKDTPGAGHLLGISERLVKFEPHSSSDFRRWFDRHRARFDQLIGFRDAYAHCQGSREADTLRRAIHETRATLEACLEDRPHSGAYVAEGNALYWESGKQRLALAPLLLPGNLPSAEGSLLCFSRSDRKARSIRYLTALGGEQALEEGASHYAELERLLALKSDQTTQSFSKQSRRDDGRATTMLERLRDAALRSLARAGERGVHCPEAFVERVVANSAFEGWLERDARVLLVLGPEGAGTSSFLCRLVEGRLRAGQSVVFASAEQLPDMRFPEALASSIGYDQQLTQLLVRAANESPDGKLLVVLDDVVVSGKKGSLLMTLLQWNLQQRRDRVRFVLGVRSLDCGTARQRFSRELADNAVCLLDLPRFSAHDVRQLAERLPCSEASERVLEARRKLVAELLLADEDATRRPGFLVSVLQRPADELDPAKLSPVVLRAEQFARACGGRAASLREPLLLRLAQVMCERQEQRVQLYDPLLRGERDLLFKADGFVTQVYADLVENGTLLESEEQGERFVSFASPALFAYVAASTYRANPPWPAVVALGATEFEPALDIGAHLVARWAASPEAPEQAKPEGLTPSLTARLLRALAALDRRAFARLLSIALANPDVTWVLSTLQAIWGDGQPRLAARGLAELARLDHCPRDVAERAHLLCANVLWDLDEYDAVEHELDRVSSDHRDARLMRAMVATARGDFADAKARYDELAKDPDTGFVANVSMRSAPVLIQLGEGAHAEALLRAALAALSASDCRERAELLGSIGSALAEQGRYREAEDFYEQSMAVNRRLGVLVGQGVVHALLGDLRCREQRWPEAEVELERALDIARRVDNHWREAWVLLRLAQVFAARGDQETFRAFDQNARTLYARIGCRPQ